jgi:hypothetical protein
MAEKYLLTLEERAGENEFITRHLIEAEDIQMVKYHYHRTLKDWGYTDTAHGKHRLESWNLGLSCEIQNIRPLERQEWGVLREFLPTWAKV